MNFLLLKQYNSYCYYLLENIATILAETINHMLRQPARFDRATLSKTSIKYPHSPKSTLTSTKFASAKSEFIGFRRLAKSYTRSFTQWSEYWLTGKVQSEIPESLQPLSSHENETDLPNNKARFERNMHGKLSNHGLGLNNNNGYKTLPITRNRPSLSLNNQDKFEQHKKNRKPKKGEENLRVLVMKNIPAKVGIDSVLSQIYGGPLERLILHTTSKASWAEISFIKPEHAQQYYNYGTRTGLLIINGAKLTLEWANPSNTEDVGVEHPAVSKYLLTEILNHDSRRCLTFSRDVPGKTLTKNPKKLHYPDPKTHISKGLNFATIKRDFDNFGELISINPVISRKLAFSIVFADIRSSIIAKRSCETKGSKMNNRYGNWQIEYGKDSADRPCLTI